MLAKHCFCFNSGGIWGGGLAPIWCILAPCGLGCYLLWGGGSVVDLLFYVPPIVCGGSVFVFVLVYVAMCPSCFTIILTRKRESWLLCYYFLLDVGWSAICDCGIS